MLEILKNAVVWLINFLINLVSVVLNLLFSFLPNSPFKNMNSFTGVTEFIGYLNWLIPVKLFVTTLSLWIVAITSYYIYSIALRYFKAIE